MPRHLVIPGHIAASKNIRGRSKDSYCVLVIPSTPAGDRLFAALRTAKVLVDTDDPAKQFKDGPLDIKRRNGKPIIEFLGLIYDEPAAEEDPAP